MSKKSFMHKAINAFLTAIVRTLMYWAEGWKNDAFFFIVFGDKTCTDVAWYNTNQLACDGALAVTCDVETAGAFAALSDGVEVLLEERLKEDDFRKVYEKTISADDDEGWISYEVNDEEGGES